MLGEFMVQMNSYVSHALIQMAVVIAHKTYPHAIVIAGETYTKTFRLRATIKAPLTEIKTPDSISCLSLLRRIDWI